VNGCPAVRPQFVISLIAKIIVQIVTRQSETRMIVSQETAAADKPVIRIRPVEDSPGVGFRELWSYRELLYFLVWRDVKVRYKQTAIGAAWAVLQPMLTMLVFTVVFGNFTSMPSDGLPYPLFSYTALLPWTYFSKALTQSILSVVGNSNLITKVYFPRLLLPLSAVVAGLIDFAIAFVFLLVMMGWYGVVPNILGMLLLPVFLLITVLTALAVSLWLSVINVRYRDVGQGIPFFVQLWLFASPVVYPLSSVPEKWRLILGLNPMTGVIEGFRWALLGKEMPDVSLLLISVSVVMALLFTGVIYFKRMEATFADVV
jgi:lipopolysaccharide transport system permease protein